MAPAAYWLPLCAQALLVFILAFVMGRRRFRAISNNEVQSSAIIGDHSAWPKPAILAANAFANQFEMPVLFYVLTIAAIVAGKTDMVFLGMAWLFVATRYVHAFIHVTSNRMPQRFYAFIAGVVILLLMWLRFAAQTLFGRF